MYAFHGTLEALELGEPLTLYNRKIEARHDRPLEILSMILIWGFPQMGVPQSSSISNDGIFPYKPIQLWGTPMTMESPMCEISTDVRFT